jgi:hypothetical protein
MWPFKKTPSSEERLRAAIAQSDKEPNLEKANIILKQAFEKEIAAAKSITDGPGFRDWIDGAQFDLSKARART